ncbi:MAG: hypothetical protein Kow00128_07970 [Deltaproteobacteria bacterium]
MTGTGSLQVPRKTAAMWLAPVLFLGISMLFSARIHHIRSLPPFGADREVRVEGLLAEISRRPAFAFGFRNLLGDLAWLSAVQVAGSRRMAPAEYDRLYLLLRTVGNYDPRFVVPYLLGGMVLGNSERHIPEALDILERGWKTHPNDWRFPFYIGYTRYFSLGDPLGGAQSLEAAARIPGSPSYIPLLATRMYSEGRAPETALAFLAGMIREETDPARLEQLRRRTREVIVERDIQALERAVAEYRARTGRMPEDLSDLVRERVIPKLPVEPHGGSYRLSPDGSVHSDRVSTRLKVFRPR